MPESKHRRGGRARTRARRAPSNRTKHGRPVIINSAGKTTPIASRRRRVGWMLIVTGVVVFIQHLFSHMGFFTVFSPGVDDLLIGYPTAGILVFLGAMMQG